MQVAAIHFHIILLAKPLLQLVYETESLVSHLVSSSGLPKVKAVVLTQDTYFVNMLFH